MIRCLRRVALITVGSDLVVGSAGCRIGPRRSMLRACAVAAEDGLFRGHAANCGIVYPFLVRNRLRHVYCTKRLRRDEELRNSPDQITVPVSNPPHWDRIPDPEKPANSRAWDRFGCDPCDALSTFLQGAAVQDATIFKNTRQSLPGVFAWPLTGCDHRESCDCKGRALQQVTQVIMMLAQLSTVVSRRDQQYAR